MDSLTTSPLARVFEAYKAKIPGHFKPNKRFYLSIGINPKRFGQLLRGDTLMYTSEAKQLADFFQIDITDLL